MKVLALSDVPLKPEILHNDSLKNIDLIITCGDFNRSDLQDLENIITIPKVGVYGNHCVKGQYGYMTDFNIFNLNLKTFEINGLVLGGFEGCVRYKNDAYAAMYSQTEALEMMQNFSKVDIFISHCPPLGINDDQTDISHTGFKALRDYLDIIQPSHWFHGHTYPNESNIIRKYRNTLIHYIYGEVILEI